LQGRVSIELRRTLMIWMAIVEALAFPAVVFVGDNLDLVDERGLPGRGIGFVRRPAEADTDVRSRSDVTIASPATIPAAVVGALGTPAWLGHGAHLIS
jgi:hypothetical protein